MALRSGRSMFHSLIVLAIGSLVGGAIMAEPAAAQGTRPANRARPKPKPPATKPRETHGADDAASNSQDSSGRSTDTKSATPNANEARTTDPRANAPAGQSSDAAVQQYRTAVAFQNKGAYEFAVDEWNIFLKNHADDPLAGKAEYYLGVCHFQMQKFDAARESFEKVIARRPPFEMLDAALLNLGKTYYSLGQGGKNDQLAKGADALARLVKEFPKSTYAAQALFDLGEILYAQGKKAEAAREWSELVKNYPREGQRAEALYNLGVVQEELGQQQQAGEQYDLFLKEFPDHALATEVGLRKGDTLLAAGKPAEAEKRFATAAQAKNFAAADYALLRQGAAQFEQKKYPEAAATYAALATKYEESSYVPTATLAAGNSFYLAGNYPEARKWLGRAVGMSSEIATEAAHWLSRAHLKEKQPAEALKVAEAAIPKAGKSPFAASLMLDKADALYELPNRQDEAKELYADVAKKYPESGAAPQAQYMAAFSALGSGDFAAAISQSSSFLKSYPEHRLATDVQVIAAEGSLLSGKHADAEERYSRLLSSQASHPDAGTWQVRRATAAVLDKKYDDAIKQLEPIAAKIKNADQAAEAQHLLGTARLETKNYAGAVKAFQAALKAQPRWRQADETLLHLARAQRQLDDLKAAQSSLETLIKDFPDSKLLDVAHYRLAEYAYAANDMKTAMEHYRQVTKNWPKSATAPYAAFGLGWVELGEGKPADAVKTLTSLLDNHSDHALANRARFVRASALQQSKQYDKALQDLAMYLKSDASREDRSEALYIQALAQIGSDKTTAATKTLETILQEDPKYANTDKVLYELAWLQRSGGKPDEANRTFARLTTDFPKSNLATEGLYHVADAQYAAKDYAAAAAGYREVLAKAGKSEIGERAAHKLGWALYQQEKFEDAQAAFEDQLKSYPSGELAGPGNLMVGETLFKNAKHKTALAALEKAIASEKLDNQSEALARLHAGQAAMALKEYDKADKHLSVVTKDFADTPYAAEATYELGLAKREIGQLDEASKLLTTLADSQSGLLGTRSRMAVAGIMVQRKNHNDALRQYFKVAYGFDDSAPAPIKTLQATATLEAGRCFETLGRLDQAKKMYNEVVNRYPNSDGVAAAQERLKALN